jgi:rod shape-determining protein MreD
MSEYLRLPHWRAWGVYLLLAVLLIFVRLLPLSNGQIHWPAPDLLLVFTIVWAARRPDLLPIFIVFIVFFAADALFANALGLETALVLLTVNLIRQRVHDFESMPFVMEWLLISAGLLVFALLHRLGHLITFLPVPPLWYDAALFLGNALVYPIVVWICAVLFGIRHVDPHET